MTNITITNIMSNITTKGYEVTFVIFVGKLLFIYQRKIKNCLLVLCLFIYFFRKGSASLAGLRRHHEIVHEKLKDHSCNYCTKKFALLSDAKKHMKYVHEKVKDEICDLCGKIFGKTTSLKKHKERIHDGLKYPCTICHKNLCTPYEVKTHIETVHEGQKNHQCTYCGKKFGRKDKLRCHIKTLHKETIKNMESTSSSVFTIA